MKLFFHQNFTKQLSKLTPKEKDKTKNRLSLFLENPAHPLLGNHPLRGKYLDYRNINIGGDLRAVYKQLSDEEFVFVAIGSHSQLYS